MGLASSQARLLNLTARLHQIEYKAAKLEAEKLQLANDSDEVYNTYLEALDATKVQYKILTTDGSVTYTDIASYEDFNSAGYALNYDGKTYVGEDEWEELLETLGIDPDTSTSVETLVTNIINSGMVTIVAAADDGTFYEEGSTDDDGNDVDYTDYEVSVSTDTGLQEISDETMLKKAEAQYEADMKKIDNKETYYDTQLAAIETEREATTEEMETLETVASDNVERTFKLFS